MKDLSLTLKPIFASAAADKAIANQQKALRSTQTTMERINKESKKGLKEQEDSWHRLTKATTEFGRHAVRAFGSALGGINGFQRKIEGGIKSIFNLRNVIMGSFAGATAFKIGSAVFGAGAGQVRNMRALNREFGPGLLYNSITGKSKDISEATGLQRDDVIKGMLPILRAIKETRIGDTVGRRRINSKRQLEAVQHSQFSIASQRFKTLATLNPEMGPEQIGFLLSEAGQGVEGLRGLGRSLHLGRASMADIMRDSKKKKRGVGDTVDAMFERAGYTEKAADSERGTFEFQAKAIKSTFEDALGDIGAKAIERLNERLGEGAGLAERFARMIERNGPALDKLADGLASVVEKLLSMAEKIPDALRWLDSHKSTLLTIGGIYGGLRLVGGARNLLGSALGGTAGKVAGALGLEGDGQRVFVTNFPGNFGGGGIPGIPGGSGPTSMLQTGSMLVLAGSLGYAVGSVIDNLGGLSDKLSMWAIPETEARKRREDQEKARKEIERDETSKPFWQRNGRNDLGGAAGRIEFGSTPRLGDGRMVPMDSIPVVPMADGATPGPWADINMPITVQGRLTREDINNVGEHVKEKLTRELAAQFPTR